MGASLLGRFRRSIAQVGLLATLIRIAGAPVRRVRLWKTHYRRWRLQPSKDPKVIFELIHKLNVWDDAESVSGPGSTRAYTTHLRARLPVLFGEYGIGRMFDAPCGDFNWMREVVATSSVKYLGGDIVPALVQRNAQAFASPRIAFRTFDITRDGFPEADLWFCRDCLFHLTYQQIYAALKNFCESAVPYALLTNHRDAGAAANHDIRTGDCRRLDLMAAPFFLPAEVGCRIQEGLDPTTDHEMCLWTRDQIRLALPRFKAALDASGPAA